MDSDFLKPEIHYSDGEIDTKYNFIDYQSTNNAPKTETYSFDYPNECFKVPECPVSIKPESDPLNSNTENREFPKSDELPNAGLRNVLITNFYSKQRLCLPTEAQSICLNVYHNLQQIDNLNHTVAIERASSLCGISKKKMLNLLRKGVKKRQKRCDAGSHKLPTSFTEDLETIKKRVRDYYVSDNNPTVLGLRLKLRESNPRLKNSRSESGSFSWWLRDIGFRTKRFKNRNVLFENDQPVK